MNLHALLRLTAVLMLTLASALPGRADDIDIYSNPVANPLQPPMTVIALDLNLLAICDNVVTNPNANATCGALQSTLSVQAYLNLIGGSGLLQSGLSALSPSTLCTLNNALAVPIVSALLCPTLSALGLTNLINGLAGNVTNSGAVPLGQLPVATANILNAALAAPLKVLTDTTQLFAVLQSILTPLINSRIAIIVSHANRGNTSNTAVTINGKSYACNFADLASIPGTRASTTPCSNGAYFLLGFTNLADPQAVINSLTAKITAALNPANLVASLNGLSLTPANLAPPYQGKEIYDEVVHYVSGDAVYNAPLKTYDGLLALLARDTTIESGAAYVAPNAACKVVNVLNVQLTNASVDADSDADLLRGRYFPGADQNSDGTLSFPEIVSTAQNTGFTIAGNTIKLNSYFLIQDNLSSLAALQSVGANVLTYANITGLLGLGQSVAKFLQPVLVTNASLVSTSVAASPRTVSGLLEPAFVAEFKPKNAQKPSWDGNIKQLRFRAGSNGQYAFFDVNGAAAFAADGRIATTALTYWTRSGQLGGGVSVDGRETTLGGAGQNIPGYVFGGGGAPGRVNADGARTLYYDQISSTNVPALSALDADTQAVRDALGSDLGVTGTTSADDLQRRALLLQARGYDVGTTSAPKGTGTTLTGVSGRPWLLGAVLHSRPVVVNYGARSGFTVADPDLRVLFGSADGYLHSVRNGSSSSPSGVETWAFMPRATMKNLKTLRDDVYTPQFPYGVDGAPSVLIIDRGTSSTLPEGGPADGVINASNVNDHAYAFFGLRRGGGNYYGLDISNPDSPRLMWRIGSDGLYSANTTTPGFATGSAAWYGELGLSFSTPAIGRLRYADSTNTLVTRSVLLFGGGYNGGVDASGNRIGKDLNNSRNAVVTAQVGGNDTRGNALYVVDALTGELIWKANRSASAAVVAYDATTRTFAHPLLQDSIASDVTALDTDGDSNTDRLYVGDTGGRVWRADFAGTDRSKWTISPIASLGRGHPVGAGAADTSNADDRRFFHAPDFVPARDASGAYDAVVIASGDREDPYNRATTNWLYAIRDRDIVSGKSLTATTVDGVISTEADARLIKQSGLTDLTSACAATSTTLCSAASALTNGWRLQLTDAGEKAVSPPVTVGNTVTLSSFVPPSNSSTSCTLSEGTSKLYGVNLLDSRPIVQQFIVDGDGAPRSGQAAAAGIAGELTALTPQLLAVNAQTVTTPVPLIYRTFWRERREDEEKAVAQ